jgi:para-nitrobenzyl esterase
MLNNQCVQQNQGERSVIDRNVARRQVLAAGAAAVGVAGLSGIAGSALAADAAAIAETTSGKVRGGVERGIKVFKGVPYGADTGGANRFLPPKSPVPWTGVLDALAFGDQCSQASGGGAFVPDIWASWAEKQGESENCLVLNVWTPGLRDGRKRPVMVWFHGGGFFAFSGASAVFDGVRLAERGDVVLVTLNHRLNVFGYMDLRAFGPQFSGSVNLGQQDLVHALKWVRANIAEFGGDPDNVMIFGESGGGGKVCTTMAMPSAEGLFHRAAVQSGPGLRSMSPDTAAEHTRSFIAALGLGPGEIDQLKTLPPAPLIAALVKVGVGSFAPVLDPATLPASPFDPVATPLSAKIPLIIGYNRTETTVLASSPAPFAATWETLPDLLRPGFGGADPVPIIAAIRALEPHAGPADLYFEITSERGMGAGSHLLAQRRVEASQAPTYVYRLEWETPVEGGKWRSPHSLDLPLVFDTVGKSQSIIGDGAAQAQIVADAMSQSWINFARTGNPNGGRAPAWTAYNVAREPVMQFDLKSRIVFDAEIGRRKVLKRVPPAQQTMTAPPKG